MQTTAPKPFVFVLMPFSPDFADLYNIGIKETCEKLGYHCERVDEQIYEGTILDRIYNQISKADLIVSDVTGRNANVFYETGYAHALGKTVILLTRQADDIPFDLKHFPHVIYGNSLAELRTQLGKRLEWWRENPARSLSKVDYPVEIYLNGIPVKEFERRTLVSDTAGERWVNLAMQNVGKRPLLAEDLSVALVMDPAVEFLSRDLAQTALPDGLVHRALPSIDRIFPEGWFSFEFGLRDHREEGYVWTIRLYSELGCRSFPVRVELWG